MKMWNLLNISVGVLYVGNLFSQLSRNSKAYFSMNSKKCFITDGTRMSRTVPTVDIVMTIARPRMVNGKTLLP